MIWSSAGNQSKMRGKQNKGQETRGRLAQGARVVRQSEKSEEGQEKNVNVDIEESVGRPKSR